MPDVDNAIWEGNFIDINGRFGSVSAFFSIKQNIAGLTMNIFEIDTSPEVVLWDAPLEGQSPKNGVRLETSDNLPRGGFQRWELDLAPADPGVFAMAALVGSYKVTTEGLDARLPLSSGVMIVWLFARED